MHDYIKELFYREDEANRLDFREAEAYAALDEALSRRHEQIDEALGQTFFNEYWDLLVQHAEWEKLTCFRHGFRIALRMLLG